MAKLALLVSLIALGVAILAYQEAGGQRVLGDKIQSLQSAVEMVRQETANGLARMEKALRPADGPTTDKSKPKP